MKLFQFSLREKPKLLCEFSFIFSILYTQLQRLVHICPNDVSFLGEDRMEKKRREVAKKKDRLVCRTWWNSITNLPSCIKKKIYSRDVWKVGNRGCAENEKQPLYFRFELVLNNVIGGYDYRRAHLFHSFFSVGKIEKLILCFTNAHTFTKKQKEGCNQTLHPYFHFRR